jgi:hypothetical protein
VDTVDGVLPIFVLSTTISIQINLLTARLSIKMSMSHLESDNKSLLTSDEIINGLFGHDTIVYYSKRNHDNNYFKKLLTATRKYGDSQEQYVTSIRYLDIIDSTSDADEIFSNSGELLSSGYCNDCFFCKRHNINFATNPIIGIKVYPKGVYPQKRSWKVFGKKR